MERITIDPADFSESSWVELYNACELMPRSYEMKHHAKPFKRGKGQIETAILCCRNKAEALRNEESPGAPGEDNRDWAFDLDAVAEQLEHYLGKSKWPTVRVELPVLLYCDVPVSKLGDWAKEEARIRIERWLGKIGNEDPAIDPLYPIPSDIKHARVYLSDHKFCDSLKHLEIVDEVEAKNA